MTDSFNTWERFLDPNALRERLVSVSLYITAFELLKDSICGRIESFYTIGFDPSGPSLDDKYKSEVTSRNTSKLYASLEWLIENEVIDRSDLIIFDGLKAVRNQLAHELQHYVFGDKDIDLTCNFQQLAILLDKLEKWWIYNVEIPTNPDFDGEDISLDDILPGPTMLLQVIIEVASGNRELLDTYRAMSKG
ncbi:hypothetical protein [Dyella sedimenti]|uniref:hypothetical protein n=1 Tax=Dyella sedimenti TaxID=2919947 RepID=UPI001FA9FA02|nr:hypothetical protein [Dyella sedimenti]